MTDFNYWITECHNLAKEKGWWDGEPRTDLEILALMHSEVAEATECVRNREKPFYKRCNINSQPCSGEWDNCRDCLKDNYGSIGEGKPEGEAVELVDLCIRIFDWCGQQGLRLGGRSTYQIRSFGLGFHATLHRSLANIQNFMYPDSVMKANQLQEVVDRVLCYLERMGWDFENVLKTKHVFNTTRPYRHGGKSA